jgi:3-dehydroquinate dehydratase/shikimate dehydrogenase
MICVSIANESRRLAMADMLTAAHQADLLEVRLDRFDKAPDFKELLAARRKPVILTCRRARDGGDWQGSEEERLALLRQAVIDKADYVEIELDVADQIRPYPGAKRVISYTNLGETPEDIADVYGRARAKNPDVIKLTTLARTPEEAWPLLQILARSSVPTVAVGLGKPGVMLTVLGKKIGAPWAYAALGRGLETYPGEPTVEDLEAVYHYRAIERTTRLIGVTGFDERATATVAGLNAALAHLGLPARCWPSAVGSPALFRKIIDAAKLAAVVVDDGHQGVALDLATERDASAEQAQAADLLLHKADRWRGYHTQGGAAVAELEAALGGRAPSGPGLQGKIVAVVGTGNVAVSLARAVQARGASLIIASHERDRAQRLAQELGCRYVQFEALYTTLHDVLAVCAEEADPLGRSTATGVHPGYLRPGMAVLDLTAGLRRSPLLREAEARGCAAVAPGRLFADRLAVQARLLTGKVVPHEVFASALERFLEEDASA